MTASSNMGFEKNVEAETMREAIDLAERENPGNRVVRGMRVTGPRYTPDLVAWMQSWPHRR